MDNQTHNSENEWVDNKLASLVPPGDWHPDSKRALAQLLKRQDRQEAAGSPRWIRFSMAAAVLASIGLVVALLPWHALWQGTKTDRNLPPEPSNAATPELVPEPTPAPVAVTPPVRSKQELKPAEHVVPGETVQQAVPPNPDPNYSDEARRAHIQGTVAALQQTAPPATEQEQKPAERVGPGVTAPHIISPTSEPDYTDEARQAHIQGTVVLSIIIRADGTAKVDKVVRGIGYGLDEKAIALVEKWKFAPATKDGKPVDVAIQVVINFHLY